MATVSTSAAPLSGISTLPQSSAGTWRFGLDLARALAITMVMISHGMAYWAPFTGNHLFNPDGITWVAGVGGVELFFCLSGFLIGGLLLDIQDRGPTAPAIRIFLLRRWIRTLPLYFLALIAFLLIPQIEPNPQQQVWSYALLVQNLVTPMPASNWFGPSWSLTIEEWSYVALPLLAFYVCRFTRHPVACAALILIAAGFAVRVSLGLAGNVATIPDWDRLIRKLVVARSDAVAYGVLAAVLARSRAVLPRNWLIAPAVVLLGASFWLCYDPSHLIGAVGWLAFFPMTAIGFTLLLPWLATLPAPAVGSLAVQFMARISYALYLVHWGFIYVASYAPVSLQLATFVLGSLIAATVLSYAVEHPIMSLRPKQR